MSSSFSPGGQRTIREEAVQYSRDNLNKYSYKCLNYGPKPIPQPPTPKLNLSLFFSPSFDRPIFTGPWTSLQVFPPSFFAYILHVYFPFYFHLRAFFVLLSHFTFCLPFSHFFSKTILASVLISPLNLPSSVHLFEKSTAPVTVSIFNSIPISK
jgi:hypothetical protein